MLPKIRYVSIIMLTACFLAIGTYVQAQTLAFPGAEGFGRFAQGGRGGTVIHVTNLNDTGPGSLRAALEASGPRTVVFDISGNIDCRNRIDILNPYLTIAGQTAPGQGVTVMCMVLVKTHNVIMRYIRIRPGPAGIDHNDVPIPGSRHPNEPAESFSGMQVAGSLLGFDTHDVIIDHVSESWAPDENFAVVFAAYNVTIQWSLQAEPLTQGGKEAFQGKGFAMGNTGGTAAGVTVSFHHNILATDSDRVPYVIGGSLDLVNNLVYNWYASANFTPFDPILVNAVNNYYLRGPNSIHATYDYARPLSWWGCDGTGLPCNIVAQSLAYFSGNIEPLDRPDNSRPELDAVYLRGGGAPLSTTRLNFPQVTTTDAFTAKTDVLANAGATKPARDAVDNRIITAIINGTGQLVIDNPSEVGGYPDLPAIQRPAGYDTDGDGMPDSWELAHGLNPDNPADGAQQAGNGYTNLENYLNDMQPANTAVLPAPRNLRIGG